MLNEIPEMYHHCKSTEDKDMTPLDFITDHLVNIDGLFDKHENGDEQKPHTHQFKTFITDRQLFHLSHTTNFQLHNFL